MTTPAYTDITVDEWEPGITRLTISRPHLRNAYRSHTAVELSDAIDRFQRDDRQRVLVLTGAGGAFCAGGDLTSTYEVEHAEEVAFGHSAVIREGLHRVIRGLQACEKPVIAMIEGAAVAGGLTLALACDLRIADRTAKVGDTSGRVALLPDEGGAWFFPRAMGVDHTLKMLWGADLYAADEALRLGLVTEVVEEGLLPVRVLELARRFAAAAPLTNRVVKRMVRAAVGQSLEQALHEAEYAVCLINDSVDVREGARAFTERRTPRFTGR